jgi:type IV pilus assembly protein PilY1
MMNLAVAPSTSLAFDCKTWLNQIGVCGSAPLPACPATATDLRTKCAEQIIYFYRGYDVQDWDGDHCAGPGNYYNTNGWGTCTTNANCGAEASCVANKCVNTNCTAAGEQRDRVRDSRSVANQEFWKLGDIFHSSPVLVKPPYSKAVCNLRNTQCIPTLYSAAFAGSTVKATPLSPSTTPDAYDAWRTAKLARPQVVVVGANDFMLHAFDAGSANTGAPKTVDGAWTYSAGTGAELWAFIPPDLLPRLKDGLDRHVYGVDGATMVKDIWYDTNGNGTKEAGEFHTIAVITERGGGARLTALDLTDPTTPAFLWTFPEPGTDDSRLMGQTWSDFLPRASPIVPVRIATTTNGPKDPLGRSFEERWVVMANGGYDPAMVRGRAIWMLDAWTGTWLWRFTDDDFKAMRGRAPWPGRSRRWP